MREEGEPWPGASDVSRAVEPTPRVIVCDVGGVVDPDLRVVDALARVRLAAERLGFEFRLHGSNPELEDLLDLAGLRDVLPFED
jgi:anti-anti-sigma regulatory factor